MTVRLHPPEHPVRATIGLPASKSIANRALIIQALGGLTAPIENLGTAQDTRTLQDLLSTPRTVYDAGPAGTVFRFLTAFLAQQPGAFTLTGSERMKQRPIGLLVDALRALGAEIHYIDKEGFPPLQIEEGALRGGSVSIDGSVSSQFISALMMLGPVLRGGLELHITGQAVSQPYVAMTANLMRLYGANPQLLGSTWHIPQTGYKPHRMRVESDWSAASYWFSIAALSPHPVDIVLENLPTQSVQGDAVLQTLFPFFGVRCTQEGSSLRITSAPTNAATGHWQYDFTNCPDIAQTMAVVCAFRGQPAHLTGLQTLRHKETDRIAALVTELQKCGAEIEAVGDELHLSGKLNAPEKAPCIATYHDHRMAMAFAPAAFQLPGLCIKDGDVVGKSYPSFWSDLAHAGFSVSRENQ